MGRRNKHQRPLVVALCHTIQQNYMHKIEATGLHGLNVHFTKVSHYFDRRPFFIAAV